MCLKRLKVDCLLGQKFVVCLLMVFWGEGVCEKFEEGRRGREVVLLLCLGRRKNLAYFDIVRGTMLCPTLKPHINGELLRRTSEFSYHCANVSLAEFSATSYKHLSMRISMLTARLWRTCSPSKLKTRFPQQALERHTDDACGNNQARLELL